MKQKKQILEALLAKAKELPAGTAISTVQLFHAVFPAAPEPDFKALMELEDALFQHAEDAGLFLDMSKHWMKEEGLPFNLDFIINPLKRVVSFDVVKYNESGYPGPSEELVIDLRAKTISYSAFHVFDQDKGYGQYSHQCNATEWDEIADLIAECRFDQWEKEYYEPVLDGTQWELSLIKGKRCVKKCSGSNGYPTCWEIFWALKERCRRLLRKEAIFVNKPETCPFCGSKAVKPYLYGMPTTEAFESGKYIIGGCCVEENQPKWGCADCGAKFFEGDPWRFDLEEEE